MLKVTQLENGKIKPITHGSLVKAFFGGSGGGGGGVMPVTCGSSWATDGTCAMAVTRATGVTMLDL